MNSNKYKVFDVFEKENKPLFFREISKKTGVSIGGVQKVLKDNEFFFDKEVKGRNTYYFVKKGIFKDLFTRLIESERFILFIKKNKNLKDFFERILSEKIFCVVFGSYAGFRNKKGSDLDLLVVGEKEVPEHLCPVELHIIKTSKKDFEKSLESEKLIQEIKRNHIIIYGMDYFLEVLKNERR